MPLRFVKGANPWQFLTALFTGFLLYFAYNLIIVVIAAGIETVNVVYQSFLQIFFCFLFGSFLTSERAASKKCSS